MAEISFHYLPAHGPLQHIDARVKLLSVFLLSVVTFSSETPGLLVISAFLATCAFLARIGMRTALRELRVFLVFAGLIVAASSINIAEAPDARAISLFSIAGFKEGLIVAWRFVDLILLGVVFTASTSVTEVRRACEAILSYIPGLNARKIAFMVGATVSMLPLISDAAEETRMAQQARSANKRRNPIVRIVRLSLPLLIRVFRMTDEMAYAMQARGLDFSKMRARNRAALRGTDYLALATITMICAAAIVLGLTV